jgi:hypothetical protein
VTDAVTISLIAAIASTLSAFGTTMAVIFGARNGHKLTEVRSLVDGRMSQVDAKLDQSTEALRALTAESNFAAGKLEQKTEDATNGAS